MVESAVQSRAEIVVGSSENKLIRVLHVDDELGFLKIAKQCLEMQGPFHVDTAGSVGEALNKLKETEYDAVVSDYQMPGKDGLEFLEMLRKNGNTIPFVMFTGKGREEVAVKAWSLGADHYVNKTGDPETVYCELAHCLRSTVEKHFAEAQMKETVQKLQTIYQNAVEGISYVDAEENIVYANKAFAGIVGYEQDQLAGMSLRRLADDENWARIENETNRRRQGESSRYEVEFRRSDGTVRNTLISGAPLLDHDGRFVGTIGIVLDITEQKKTKEAIKESEERFKSIFESVDDGLIYLDTTGRIIEINRKAVEFFGGSKEELLGKHFTKIGIFPIKEMPTLTKRFVDILLGKRTILDITIKNKKGQAIPLECSASLSKAYDKSTIAVVARDMTERRERERLLREREEKYRSLVEQSMQGIVIAQGSIPHMVFANFAMSKILGYSVEELLSLSPQQTIGLVHQDDRELFFGRFKDRLEGKPVPPQYEVRGIRKDGTIVWLELSSARIEYGGQPAVQAIFTDITERKKTEEEAFAERDRLETVTRSIGAGLAIISKDYRTLWANDVLKKIFGDVEGKICYSVYNQRSSICPGCGVREIFEAGKAKVVHEQVGKDVDGKTVWSEITATPVKDRDGNITAVLELVVPITERKKAEEQKNRLAYDLNERAKELRCLYGISKLVETSRITLDGILQGTTNLLPEAWQYPEITGARVVLEDQEFVTSNFKETRWRQQSEINVQGRSAGFVEVCYLEEKPDIAEGPFLKEERMLIDAVAERLGRIIERIRTEECLKSSNERLGIMFENAPDAYYISDLAGHFIDGNRVAEEMTGYRKDELIGKSFLQLGLLSKKQIPTAVKLLALNSLGKSTGPDELVLNRKDGTWVVVEIRTVPTKIGDKTVVLGIARDVTERTKIQKTMAENQAKFKALFVGSPEAGVFLDGDFHVADINPRFEELFGYSLAEIKGKHINDAVVPSDKLKEARSLDCQAIQGYAHRNTWRRRKDRSLVPVSVSVAPIIIEDRLAGYIGIYKDISELRNTQKKLETMNEKLRVVGGLTRHDVRNKLSLITGNIYLTKKKLVDHPDVLGNFNDMQSACEQIVRIFEFAKDYERLGIEELGFVNVETTVDKAVSLFSDLKGLRIVNECHGLTVLADSLLERFFYNLIDNSLKYGEKLTKIRIYYEKSESQLKLIYEDDGVGIPKDAKTKLFTEGFTTGKGSGYGLYLIGRIMEVYGWTINETGTHGKGAQFTINMPRAKPDGRQNYKLR
ncbi:MAG: PAS domain S-box protein [Candidatus Bathyarchaeia archaeon]|jgi:PAS domain S-box-containing protein